ncbi:MAG: DUF4139 domain-containing protein [Planctomycetia bacterium]|nr:DUF4139 domain-containing protein [Planctomycetia bacterium]
MRRKLLAAAAAGGVALSTGLFVHFSGGVAHSGAEPNSALQPASKGSATQLPINQVVLFSSGVGYFQRQGEVEGNNRIDLSFPVQDVNDLLKSMVLQDMGNGHVSAVSYDSQAPVEKTLRSFAINLTGNPTFGGILNQARGEKVEAILQQSTTQPGTITGVIMGVEQKREAVGKEVVEAEFINLWCAEGMRSIRMSDIQRVRFLNPVMDSEVKKALETLSLSHDTQKKAVSISFAGEGKRTVKVGYVVENPIWKTSYRLVMKDKGKPYLQGWAVVENTQDEDWNNVRMSLVSGRPISFQMDLYQPLFVNRPVVEPELFASLRPPTYQGAMEKAAQQLGQAPGFGGGGFNGRAGRGPAPEADALARKSDKDRNEAREQALYLMKNNAIDPGKSVSSAAAATELGDFFQYAIEQPVSLARQKSAMLPIVTQEIDGTKVSIYNQNTHPKFPLLGLKFKNTTDLHLMQGPITVFEGNSYAGDARILDLQPKEERLISYAIDLGTEVEPVVANPTDRIIKVKITRGIVEATHKINQSKTYNVKNRSQHDRTLIVEHPYRAEFKLMAPEKFNERARDVYRFEVPVKSQGTAKLDVVEERDTLQSVTLSNTDDQTLRFFINHNVSSPAVKKALEGAVGLKNKVADTQRELAHANQQLKDITDDQNRLRANLKEMPPTAAAYKRYLEKFDKQETEIEQLREKIKQLQNQAFQQRRAFEDYLTALNVD